MGFINLQEKTINAKLVYYGVGLGGKTTSLKAVHEILCPKNEAKLVSINTEQDATLLFDFLPIDLGSIGEFKIRIQGFTVPGQAKYVVMRKYVLSGADAVVLVADSKADRLEENLQAIRDLKRNLRANGLDWQRIPLVLQYNKRDLEDALPLEELSKRLRFREVPEYETVATSGEGVLEAFARAAALMVEEKVCQYGLAGEGTDPVKVAEEAAERILEAARKSGGACSHDSGAVREQGLVDVIVSEEAAEDLGVKGDDPEASGSDLASGKGGRLLVDEGLLESERTEETPDLLEEGLEEIRLEGSSQETAGAEGREAAPERSSRTEEAVEGSTRFSEESGEVPKEQEGLGEEEAVGLLGQAITSNMEMAGLYAELAEYKSLLERKNRELVEVNQLISHDLKKPLTVFKTVVRLMLGGQLGELTETQKDAIQNASDSVDYMEELIEDIVESSRLDYDGVKLEFEETDMTLLFGTIVKRLRYLLGEQEVRAYIEPLPKIVGDPKALTKVFMNLLGNSIRYRDPQKQPRYIKVRAEERENDWVFLVEDNGIGIPEASLSEIWGKFSRGSNTSGVTGTGLGLYIVRELVLAHGGEVSVESEVGKGTTFFIQLPKEPVQADHSPVHCPC